MSFTEFIQLNQREIMSSLFQHLSLVFWAVAIGMVIAVPVGIILSRHRKMAAPVLAFAGTIQTIPGLVMLGIALIFWGIGTKPALIVLSLYAILPILRNTYTGITDINPGYVEAARGIGMTSMQRLLKVELPIATPTIIGGIRISTVYIISWATLAGLIGAGGLGDLIWTGLSTYNTNYILAGAVPSAIMAILFNLLIGGLQRGITPRGLRRVNP
jgi:osmoprotectant transport system permease protein